MSPTQTAVYSALWILFAGLLALIALLYRQLDKAYARANDLGGGLQPGAQAPDVNVIADDEQELLRWPEPDALMLLSFVTSECPACSTLLDVLRDFSFEGRMVALVSGTTNHQLSKLLASQTNLELRWPVHPPDAAKSFGVSRVPLVYVIRGRTILGSGAASTRDDLRKLIDNATSTPSANGEVSLVEV